MVVYVALATYTNIEILETCEFEKHIVFIFQDTNICSSHLYTSHWHLFCSVLCGKPDPPVPPQDAYVQLVSTTKMILQMTAPVTYADDRTRHPKPMASCLLLQNADQKNYMEARLSKLDYIYIRTPLGRAALMRFTMLRIALPLSYISSARLTKSCPPTSLRPMPSPAPSRRH